MHFNDMCIMIKSNYTGQWYCSVESNYTGQWYCSVEPNYTGQWYCSVESNYTGQWYSSGVNIAFGFVSMKHSVNLLFRKL